jgi:hypothetical protein
MDTGYVRQSEQVHLYQKSIVMTLYLPLIWWKKLKEMVRGRKMFFSFEKEEHRNQKKKKEDDNHIKL